MFGFGFFFKCANSCSKWKQGNVALIKTNIYFIIENAGQSFILWLLRDVLRSYFECLRDYRLSFLEHLLSFFVVWTRSCNPFHSPLWVCLYQQDLSKPAILQQIGLTGCLLLLYLGCRNVIFHSPHEHVCVYLVHCKTTSEGLLRDVQLCPSFILTLKSSGDLLGAKKLLSNAWTFSEWLLGTESSQQWLFPLFQLVLFYFPK